MSLNLKKVLIKELIKMLYSNESEVIKIPEEIFIYLDGEVIAVIKVELKAVKPELKLIKHG